MEKAPRSHRFGPYTLQAAIAAVHAEARSTAATDWRKIVALYDQLVRIHPSPVALLNRAVALAMRDGPEAGLAHIEGVMEQADLQNYHLAHSAMLTCAGGWAGPRRPGLPMRGRWRSPSKNRSDSSCWSGFGICNKNNWSSCRFDVFRTTIGKRLMRQGS